MKLSNGLLFCTLLLLLVASSTQRAGAITGSGWIKHLYNPVLSEGLGTWDDLMVYDTCVIKDGSTYKMWYTGYDGSVSRIGYATSSDGASWVKESNPVLTIGSSGEWDQAGVLSPWVIKEGSAYKMWYVGTPDGIVGNIGLAISSDGIVWTKKGIVLPSSSTLSQPDVYVSHPTVIKDGSSYVMWYSAQSIINVCSICVAYSGDGFKWSKYDGNLDGIVDAVLSTGTLGSWDHQFLYDPAVVKSGEVYFMWYAGSDGSKYAIGLASSADGKVWTKSLANPVLSPSLGQWDGKDVKGACVIQDRLDFKMWYTGSSTIGGVGIGYAVNFMRMAGSMGLIDAPGNTVYYIYPDYQGAKPAGTGPAALSDWLAMGMLLGMSANLQQITTDTHTSVVDSNGVIVVDPGYSVILAGGPFVSGPVKYYEQVAKVTPAYFQLDGSTYRFYNRTTGQAISGTDMSQSVVATNQDMFIMEAFKDPATGRHVIILYGYGWKGTYAATLAFRYAYFDGRLWLPTLFDDALYVYKWTDANGDGFVDANEISFAPVAYGN